MRRHRFITDSWGWEVRGGAINPGEEPAAAAARELGGVVEGTTLVSLLALLAQR